MKIMIVCLSMQSGGTERVVANLANHFCKKNTVVLQTILNNKIHYELDDKIKILCIDKKPIQKISYMMKKLIKVSPTRIISLKKNILKENPDILLCFLPLPSFYIMFLKRIYRKVKNIPVILSERGDPNITFKNNTVFKIMKKLYKRANGFVFQTEEAREFYKNIIKCDSKIIFNPVNEKFIKKEPARQRKKIIVSVGRLEKQKNNKLLIDAFEEVHQKHKEYKLMFYGEGSLKSELIKYVETKGLSDYIKFVGISNKLEEDIYNAEIFVLSSDFEGMPNALIEAMALGIPCIATNCPVGGPKILISNENNGILIETKNKIQLADSINKLIDNHDLANLIAINAINTVKQYDPKKINKEWEQYVLKIRNKHN